MAEQAGGQLETMVQTALNMIQNGAEGVVTSMMTAARGIINAVYTL